MSVHGLRTGPSGGNPYETDVRAALATARNLTPDRRLDTVGVQDGVTQQELLVGAYTYRVASQAANNDLETRGHESIVVGGNTVWSARFDTRVFKENMQDGVTPLAVLGFYGNVQRAIDKKDFPVAGMDGAEDEPILMPAEGTYDEPSEGETPLVYTVTNQQNTDQAPSIDQFEITEAITYGEAVLFLAHRAGGWTEGGTIFVKPTDRKVSPARPATNGTRPHASLATNKVVSLAEFRNRKRP